MGKEDGYFVTSQDNLLTALTAVAECKIDGQKVQNVRFGNVLLGLSKLIEIVKLQPDCPIKLKLQSKQQTEFFNGKSYCAEYLSLWLNFQSDGYMFECSLPTGAWVRPYENGALSLSSKEKGERAATLEPMPVDNMDKYFKVAEIQLLDYRETERLSKPVSKQRTTLFKYGKGG